MGHGLGVRTRDLIDQSLQNYPRRFRDDARLSDADVMHWAAILRRQSQSAFRPIDRLSSTRMDRRRSEAQPTRSTNGRI